MKVSVQNKVLLVEFDEKEIPAELDNLGTLYEGKVPGRIGVNLPMYVLRQKQPAHPFCRYEAEYIICYPSWEKSVLEHEVLHARYFLDKEYRKKVLRMWKKQSVKYQNKVFQKMRSMGYPEEVWLDEWQAYLFTNDLDLGPY
jgi:hypothetical protein